MIRLVFVLAVVGGSLAHILNIAPGEERCFYDDFTKGQQVFLVFFLFKEE